MTALKQQLWKRRWVLFENQSKRCCRWLADIFWWVPLNLLLPFNLNQNVIQKRYSLFFHNLAEKGKLCLAFILVTELEMCIKGSLEWQVFVCNLLLELMGLWGSRPWR